MTPTRPAAVRPARLSGTRPTTRAQRRAGEKDERERNEQEGGERHVGGKCTARLCPVLPRAAAAWRQVGRAAVIGRAAVSGRVSGEVSGERFRPVARSAGGLLRRMAWTSRLWR